MKLLLKKVLDTLEFEWLKEGKKSATIHVENNFISRINGEERK